MSEAIEYAAVDGEVFADHAAFVSKLGDLAQKAEAMRDMVVDED